MITGMPASSSADSRFAIYLALALSLCELASGREERKAQPLNAQSVSCNCMMMDRDRANLGLDRLPIHTKSFLPMSSTKQSPSLREEMLTFICMG